jgi:transcriptional regulator of arginine metabolism
MGAESAQVSDDSVRRILREFLHEVAIAQNIVVLKTGVANASTVSLAIDNAGWPEVVGSLAGDDTVFVVVRKQKESQDLKKRILAFLK